MDYAENIVQLLAALVALLLCLFRYISNKRRGWVYAIVFFLCNLLSCYYWTAFLIITGDEPVVSDLLTYTGWNAAFFVLFLLLLHMKTPEERRYFHPLMLLPIPLNTLQFTLYLPYGSLLNNIYQVGICTLLAVFGLQGLCWYRKKRYEGAAKPYVSLAVLLFAALEFGMWTSSCMSGWLADLYYPCSFLCSACYLLIAWAIGRTYAEEGKAPSTTFDRKYQNILKLSYLGIVLIFSVGGIVLGLWMRDMLTDRIQASSASGVYDIIPIVLFVISLVLVIFAVAVIFVVYFGQKAAENNELQEARRIAERSSAAKSEFLANMSHEIRTPINAVMGMNEIIMRDSRQARDQLPDSTEEIRGIFSDISGYAGIIENAGKNLLAIINDILDISKIEAGKVEIREARYTLSSTLNDLCNMISLRARSKDLEFRVNVQEQLPDQLCGDVLRVRQVVLNILNNAVKYTNRGSVTLSVAGSISAARDQGQIVDLIFSVKDTGIGIRREDLDRLFAKFERISSAENSNVEGTGLGLAITKTLLDMMGGSIRVESEFGKGSVFTVTIPQKYVSPEPIGNFRERFEKSAEEAGVPDELFRATGARILVVDDTRMNLIVAEGLLKNTEMQIDTAESGSEALRLTQAVLYDVILMDQRMPVMDGTEALHLIRKQADGLNRSTPVICLTADAISGAREQYLAQGFTDYLTKPIDSSALRRMLMRYLPAEKVILLGVRGQSVAPADGQFAALQDAGFDVSRGLFHSQQDAALYRSLLREFANTAGEKMQVLQSDYEAGAWKDYAIRIHALKSSAATIGAAELSRAAARLEDAVLHERNTVLRQDHPAMLELCRRTADAIRDFRDDPDLFPAENDGVIEFPPADT